MSRNEEDFFRLIQEQSIKIDYLLKKTELQELRISSLEKENFELRERLSKYEQPKKDSSNSSISPSQDPHRLKRTSSLRSASGKKPGGQPGHKGSTLKMSEQPDAIVDHAPNFCHRCGCDLSDVPAEFSGSRQLIDLPPIVPIITEHRVFRRVCLCGHCTEGNYPTQVHSKVCYGEGVMSLAAYFSARQYLSYDRLREMFSDVFSLPLSGGTLVNLINNFSEKASLAYQQIKERLLNSAVVGADETGVCINGKNHWAWTFQNQKCTCIVINPSRGKKAIEAFSPYGFPNAIMVHDCWKPYFNTPGKSHQICSAHLLRELNYLQSLYPKDDWAKSFKDLLMEAIHLKKELKQADYLRPIEARNLLKERLDRLLSQEMNPKLKKVITFRKRMIKYRNYLFTFLYHHNITHHNNDSERAVRTFKVKLKVSGLFRSPTGANSFAKIRSVIDTAIKNSQNVLDALRAVAMIPAE